MQSSSIRAPTRTRQFASALRAALKVLRRARNVNLERGDERIVLWDAHASLRCFNPTRTVRVLAEWLASRGDQPEDYAHLAAQIIDWQDRRVISWLTDARVARLLTLKRSA